MDPYYVESCRTRIQPMVQDISVKAGVCPLCEDTLLEIFAAPGVDVSQISALTLQYWNTSLTLRIQTLEREIPSEGYHIEVESGRVAIHCSDTVGLLNAFKSLRMAAESERGVLMSDKWQLPCMIIKDAPRFAFRGLHLCFFPENHLWQIEKYIRIAAAMKFNYVVLESWGMIKFASHPEYCFEEFAVEPDVIRNLVKLGKSLGVKIVPQFNIFGHAALARCCVGKHALLNKHPEYAPLFEPDGWSWCPSNPAARRYIEDIVTELCDIFDEPEFFHIGCDEAYNAGSCSLCAENFPEKLAAHINYFHDLLKKRSVQTMMWHDMLIVEGDPAFRGFTAYGNERTCGLIDSLSRDIVLCDWEYSYRETEKLPDWPTVKFCRQHGFRTLLCPWKDARFTRELGKQAERHDCMGILATTWHHFRAQSFAAVLESAAQAAWNPQAIAGKHVVPREYINTALRYVDKDMNLNSYNQWGNMERQFADDATVN